MSINHRVKIIIDEYYNGIPRRLATALGWERADNMYNVLDEKHKKFGVDIAQAILKKHPEISAEWFLRGEGERIKGELEYPQDYEETKKELKETTAKYIKLLEQVTKLKESYE